MVAGFKSMLIRARRLTYWLDIPLIVAGYVFTLLLLGLLLYLMSLPVWWEVGSYFN